MARDLLVVALGVDFAHACSARQSANAIAAQNAGDASVGDLDVVVAREIPDDPDRPEMVFAAQIQNFLHDFGRCLVGRILRDGLCIDQPSFAALVVGSPPTVEA